MSDRQSSEVVELSVSESWALLRQSTVGRLAVVFDDRPDSFPVNHIVDRGTVVFRTADGTKLAGAAGHFVAFEVDGYDLETASAWSVVLKGGAHEVNRLYEALDTVELALFPWHASPKPHVIRIDPVSITGRRFEVTGGARSTQSPSARPAAHE